MGFGVAGMAGGGGCDALTCVEQFVEQFVEQGGETPVFSTFVGAGCAASPPRTILCGNSLLTGKITGNCEPSLRLHRAECPKTLALRGSDREASRQRTGN